MNQEKITELKELLNQHYDNLAGIVVQKNGGVVYEDYFNGCTGANPLHVFSVTKSILSILFGIALDQGKITSIDQKILTFFPDYQVKNNEEILQQVTIRHLLTMTAPYRFDTEPYEEFFTSDSWVAFALDSIGGQGQLGEFRYAPIIGPDILSGILVKATGQSVLDFARTYLFTPLDIEVEGNVVFHDQAEQFAFYAARDVSGWVADPTGVNTAAWGLTLTARDMAKIGQLLLNNGKWQGEQIVSTEWLKESMREHSRWQELDLAYGYLWWLIDEEEQSYAAMGDGGNVIYVNPQKNIVVAIASLFKQEAKDRIELIKEYIEPIFEEC